MNFFVITPHKSDPLFERKRQVVKRLATQLQMNAHYGPEPPYNEPAMEKILSLYKNIDFFIADLSYQRPSCYFEVGLVQALRKPVTLIAMEDTAIHQIFNRDALKVYKNIYEYENVISSILNTCKEPS